MFKFGKKFVFTIIYLTIIAIICCFFTSFLISLETKCSNNNVDIETIEYIFCKNNNCTEYNSTNISFDRQWLNCHFIERYDNLSENIKFEILDKIEKTNNSKCYYNYLFKCQSFSYKKIPIFVPILLMIFFVVVILIVGYFNLLEQIFFSRIDEQKNNYKFNYHGNF